MSEFYNFKSLGAFNLTEADVELVSHVLDPSSAQTKRLAWFGDAFLHRCLTEVLLTQNPNSSIEELHEKRERYEMNESMSFFLQCKAKDIHGYLKRQNSAYNHHSFGTVFEALLAISASR
jgi:dsRNA-specific ribonuclease